MLIDDRAFGLSVTPGGFIPRITRPLVVDLPLVVAPAPDPAPAPAPSIFDTLPSTAPAPGTIAVGPGSSGSGPTSQTTLPGTAPEPVVVTPSGTVVSDTPVSIDSPILITNGSGVTPLEVAQKYLDQKYLNLVKTPNPYLTVDASLPSAPTVAGTPSSLGTVAALAVAGALLYFFTRRR